MPAVLQQPRFSVGVARRNILPQPGVELAGLGYYLHRTWTSVRDPLSATACFISDDSNNAVAIVALDLMYNDAAFTRAVREQVASATALQPDAICVNFSHSHNAPTAGFIRGAGEQNEAYLRFAATQAADAVIEAFHKRVPAKLSVGRSDLRGMTFNRTRDNGPVDTRVSVLRADALDGRPLSFVVNFHSHCTAHMEVDLHAISRDWPGEVVDNLEQQFPGAIAMYLQGTCGDVNFRREFNGTEKRFEPARTLTAIALNAIRNVRPVERQTVAASTRQIALPTRRWTIDEIAQDRDEAKYRLDTGDTTGWLDGFAKVIVNQPSRLPLRYGGDEKKAVAAVCRFALEWTDEILPVLESRPESLAVEVQGIRIGDVYFAANPAELFTTLGLQLRHEWPHDDLFVLGYSNGSIGYLPDAHDIERRTYAAIQSPKFTGQFPFTERSGLVMFAGMKDVLTALS